MSKLSFAAARGALIQAEVGNGVDRPKTWIGCHNLPISQLRQYGDQVYRVHPDDEHLQYGPISTALREAAPHTNVSIAWSCKGYLEIGAICEYTPSTRNEDWAECWSELHRSLFLLILAEALADTGL